MDSSPEILLSSLRSSGVPIPSSVAAIGDLTPASLFSLCSRSLCLIDKTLSFPASLPEDSTADRFKLCSDLAAAFRRLGFAGDISFHKFLYPSEEDLYKLVRFLVGRLAVSESSREQESLDENQTKDVLQLQTEPGSSANANSGSIKSEENDTIRVDERVQELSTVASEATHRLAEGENIQEFDDSMNFDEWNTLRLPLEEKRQNLIEALFAKKPEAREKLQKKQEIMNETEFVLEEIRKRDEELSVLSGELDNQPKVASRESFVLRIKEITKNSRKQDADVERILRDTRELQLEINSIQERLNRTYAVVDETIFREARKDSVARQAYRVLAKVHESFEQAAENVLTIDRTRRQLADYEDKLATMASRSLDIDNLQADLDAIRKENDALERNTCDHMGLFSYFLGRDARRIIKRKDSDAGETGRVIEEIRGSLYSELRTSEGAKQQQQRICGPEVALTFNFFVAVSIILGNKLVMGRVGFNYPIFLTLIHYTTAWILLGIFKALQILPVGPPSKSTPFSSLFSLGAVMAFASGLANTSLKYNSVGFYQMAKIAVTPTIVVAEFILYRKKVSFHKILALAAVSTGVAVATVTDLEFNLFGAVVAVSWIVPSAINKIMWSTLQKQGNWTALALMWKTTPVTVFFLVALMPWLDPPGVLSFNWNAQNSSAILISALLGFLLQWSGALALGATSATSHVVLGQFKTCVLILGGYILFGSDPGTLSICGALTALGGMTVYTTLNLNESRQKDVSNADAAALDALPEQVIEHRQEKSSV